MAKKKFQSKATAKRFRSIGRALEASRGEIEAQTRRDVQALETAKGQAWEGRQATLGALGDITRSENANFQRLTNLEQKARSTKFDAIVKHGETVVKKFEDEAKQKQDYADYLADLAPKRAKWAGDLAKQGFETVDIMRGVNQWTALKESGLLQQMTDGKADAHDSVVYDATGKAIESTNEGDADGANYRQDTSIRLSSHWAQKKFLEWVKENKEALRNDVIQNYNTTAGNDKYGEWNAIRVQELGALGLLKKLGVSDTTRNGTNIIEQFSSWGALDKQGFFETRKVGETTGRITDLTTTLKSVLADGDKLRIKDPDKYNENLQIAYTNLTLAYKNGWFKPTPGGKVLNPNGGRGMYGNTADAGFKAIQTIIDNDPTLTYQDLNQRLGGLKTLDLKGDGKTQTWKERFPDRWETDVEQYFVKKTIKDKENNDKVLKANGIIFTSEGSQFSDLYKKYKENDFTLAELGQLNSMIQSANIDEDGKARAYKMLGYNPTSYSSGGNMRNVLNLISAGDIDEAIRVANQSEKYLSATDRAFLDTKVTLWKEISSYYEGGAVGFRSAVYGKVKGFEKEIGYQQSINNSGKLTQNVMYTNIIKRYSDLRFVDNALTGERKESEQPKKSLWNKATTEEFNLWNTKSELKWDSKSNSYIPVDGSKAYDPSNPYNYVLNKKAGEKNRNIIYIHQADADELDGAEVQGVANSLSLDSDTDSAIQAEDLSEKQNRKLAYLKNEFFKNKDTQGMKPEYITELITNGVVTEDEVFKSERLIGTQDATKIFDVLEYNASKAPLADFSFKEIPYPPQIEAIRAKFPQYTRTQILNKALFNLYGKGARVVPFDDDDCTQLKGRKKTTGEPFPYVPNNARAVAAYASCKAQNITPTSHAVKWFQEAGDAKEAFRSSLEIPPEFSDQQAKQAWLKDGGLVLEPGVDWSTLEEASLVPPKPILDRIYGTPGPRTLPKRSRE